MFLELDPGWAWYAGADPVTLSLGQGPLRAHQGLPPARRALVLPVGDGAVGFDVVAPAAVAAGVDWLLVEQDEADGAPSSTRHARSLAALTTHVAEAA